MYTDLYYRSIYSGVLVLLPIYSCMLVKIIMIKVVLQSF